jgi:ubiquinone/menaquinone biosynthesis C-methylase UbiE
MKNYVPIGLLDNFALGVYRPVHWNDFIDTPNQVILNLGAGKKLIEGTVSLDVPEWYADMDMPFEDDSVDLILAYHFFEHLDKNEILGTLLEVERILKVGGYMNIVTPHWSCEAAHQDLDHKSFWSESTWRNLFKNPFYDGTMPREWKLEEVQTVIVGLVERNLMIVSQLVKNG